ncbi:MAG: hypothetical protein U0992_16050 [Planctomycetaceae bacterium]
MKLLTLTCQHCGAPLEVSTRVSQFQCLFCGSRLYVQWADSVARAEALDDESRRPVQQTKTPEQVRIEEEIDLLDDAWMKIRARFMIPDHEGQLRVPDKYTIQGICGLGVTLGIAAMVSGFLLGWTRLRIDPAYLSTSHMLPLAGVVMIVLVGAWSRIAYRRAVDFEVHQHAYQSERRRLFAELEKSLGAITDGEAGASPRHVPE